MGAIKMWGGATMRALLLAGAPLRFLGPPIGMGRGLVDTAQVALVLAAAGGMAVVAPLAGAGIVVLASLIAAVRLQRRVDVLTTPHLALEGALDERPHYYGGVALALPLRNPTGPSLRECYGLVVALKELSGGSNRTAVPTGTSLTWIESEPKGHTNIPILRLQRGHLLVARTFADVPGSWGIPQENDDRLWLRQNPGRNLMTVAVGASDRPPTPIQYADITITYDENGLRGEVGNVRPE